MKPEAGSAKVEEWTRWASDAIGEASETPRLDARVLMRHVLGATDADLISRSRDILTCQQSDGFQAAVKRRMSGEPVAYIVGHKEFWGMEFEVGPGALTPRPDSETMIDALLRRRPDRQAPLRILDLGTGTGCLLAAALSEYPNASGVGVDRSDIAIAHACRNLKNLSLDNRATLIVSSWMDAIDEPFDVVLANPPYIAEHEREAMPVSVVEFEPHSALFSGEDGLDDFRLILAGVGRVLKQDSLVLIELGSGQFTVAKNLATSTFPSSRIEIAHDLEGRERIVIIGN